MNFYNSKPKLHFQRFEFKYLIPNTLVPQIIEDLLPYMQWDRFVATQPEKSYEVASLYYDTPRLDNYQQKLAGIKSRKKQRVRIYTRQSELTNNVFLEIKRKQDTVVIKDRVVVSSDNYLSILNNRPDYQALPDIQQDKEILEELLFDKFRGQMKPVVLVVYGRQPLIGQHNQRLRVTFDSQIKAYRTNNVYQRTGRCYRVLTNQTVLEIKYNNSLPWWLYNVIQRYHLQRESYSKYCAAVEACGLV